MKYSSKMEENLVCEIFNEILLRDEWRDFVARVTSP